jgi:hypothetical protein
MGCYNCYPVSRAQWIYEAPITLSWARDIRPGGRGKATYAEVLRRIPMATAYGCVKPIGLPMLQPGAPTEGLWCDESGADQATSFAISQAIEAVSRRA